MSMILGYLGLALGYHRKHLEETAPLGDVTLVQDVHQSVRALDDRLTVLCIDLGEDCAQNVVT